MAGDSREPAGLVYRPAAGAIPGLGVVDCCRAAGLVGRDRLPDGLGPPAVSAGYCLRHHRGGGAERVVDGVGGQPGLCPAGLLAAGRYRTAGLEAAGQLACIPAAADPAGAVAAGQPSRLDRQHIILFAAGGGAALYGRSGQRGTARCDAGQSGTGLCRRRAGDRDWAAVRIAACPAPARRADIDPDAECPAPYRALCLAAAADRVGRQR